MHIVEGSVSGSEIVYGVLERKEEVEDFSHWVMRCPRWESERWHLLTRVETRLLSYAPLNNGIQSAAITELVCEEPRMHVGY